jgi:aminopeptidase N
MIQSVKFFCFAYLLLAVLPACGEPQSLVGHVLDVRIGPERGTIDARDRLNLPEGAASWDFFLHLGLDRQIVGETGTLTRIGAREHLEHFRLEPKGATPIELSYAGSIRHRLEDIGEGMGRVRKGSRGIISEDGVVLDGLSGWYPRAPDALQHFDHLVRLPRGWLAVSEGAGPEVSKRDDGVSVRWRKSQLQDDIYLIAVPFERYEKPIQNGQAQVYLRSSDPDLAERYLEATERYLALYSALIGPYPYDKFAPVENFWDTGLGMPSFTLLGPRVIRLPFILYTSSPHEVLHNWWGNGVYVDYETGNWSEGLTAYLADNLLAEQRGRGAEYRRDSLRAYADYIREANYFPLRAFRGRHGSASQAGLAPGMEQPFPRRSRDRSGGFPAGCEAPPAATPGGRIPGRGFQPGPGQPTAWTAGRLGRIPDGRRPPRTCPQKLPHYGKYSYLVFQGEAPDNRVKGQWPARDSSLKVWLDDRRPKLATPPHRPLTAVLD